MTHKDIYTKFMIEYDKANVTSSYPSLTEYEVATLLDKAYLALIAQKVTGNNPRRVPFEADNKNIADIQPLVTHKDLTLLRTGHEPAANITQFKLPDDYLYTVSTMLNAQMHKDGVNPDNVHLEEVKVYSPQDIGFQNVDPDNIYVNWYETYDNNPSGEFVEISDVYGGQAPEVNQGSGSSEQSGEFQITANPMDKQFFRYVPVKLVTHEVAEKFFLTPYNLPWVKIPVSYIESNTVKIVYDSVKQPNVSDGSAVHFTYIRRPKQFTDGFIGKFELSDSMAEELINLAIAMALENVESPRLSTKLNTRGLEA